MSCVVLLGAPKYRQPSVYTTRSPGDYNVLIQGWLEQFQSTSCDICCARRSFYEFVRRAKTSVLNNNNFWYESNINIVLLIWLTRSQHTAKIISFIRYIEYPGPTERRLKAMYTKFSIDIKNNTKSNSGKLKLFIQMIEKNYAPKEPENIKQMKP